MSESRVFLSGVGITAVLSLTVVLYLRRHVKTILIDLCGTLERADFWTAFSNVGLVLVPFILALQFGLDVDPGTPVVVVIGRQLAQALIGLVVTMGCLGFVIGSFIPRNRPEPLPEPLPRQAG